MADDLGRRLAIAASRPVLSLLAARRVASASAPTGRRSPRRAIRREALGRATRSRVSVGRRGRRRCRLQPGRDLDRVARKFRQEAAELWDVAKRSRIATWRLRPGGWDGPVHRPSPDGRMLAVGGSSPSYTSGTSAPGSSFASSTGRRRRSSSSSAPTARCSPVSGFEPVGVALGRRDGHPDRPEAYGRKTEGHDRPVPRRARLLTTTAAAGSRLGHRPGVVGRARLQTRGPHADARSGRVPPRPARTSRPARP